MTAPAGTLAVKNLDEPDEKMSFEHGDVHVVNVAGTAMGRAVFRPGWRWSTDVKPVAGTDSCHGAHTAVVIAGRFHVRMDDGRELEMGPGDAHVVGAGHDAWVVGDEPCVIVDFQGAVDGYQPAQAVRCPCGVEIRITDAAALDHLVEAVKQHAAGSHQYEFTREQVLENVVSV